MLTIDLGQYRIRDHCNYDLNNSPDFSVFQVEIQDENLIRYYQG